MLPLENPKPDFEIFKKVLKGEEKPEKVHFVEFFIDYNMINTLSSKFNMNLKYIPDLMALFSGESEAPALGDQIYFDIIEPMIEFYYRFGYDYFPNVFFAPGTSFRVLLRFIGKKREAEDTAPLATPGVKRVWVEETKGFLTTWEDFEKVKSMTFKLDPKPIFDFISEKLPEGMKIVATGGWLLEMTMGETMGAVNLFRKLYEDPDLVKAVIDLIGEMIYNDYKEIVTYDCVGAMFHADDMGYSHGLMMKPEIYRELIFPWLKKYAALAHQHGKMYWQHSCGRTEAIMEDLIEDVKIDAYHSFQDVVIPIWEYQEKFGDRVAVLGGIDMDKYARYDVESLKKHIRGILDKCMPRGRFALGAGNTVSNFIPPENYLAVLEEGQKWRPKK